MIITEHGAFLAGLDTNKQREEGTNYIMDQLGALAGEAELMRRCPKGN